jgi:hypothetical protein
MDTPYYVELGRDGYDVYDRRSGDERVAWFVDRLLAQKVVDLLNALLQ